MNYSKIKKIATERLSRINEAYGMIEKNQAGCGNYSNNYNSNSDTNEALMKVREFINMNDILAAQNLLNAISVKNAQWNYLQGVVFMRQGFYDSAQKNFEIAINLDPMNREYQNAYNIFRNDAKGFYASNPYINFESFNTRNCCIPALCATMCCSNCCFGIGNFIRC